MSAAAAAAEEVGDKDDELSESKQKLSTLQQKWNMLWRLSLDMKKKLQDNFANLLQVHVLLPIGTRFTLYRYTFYLLQVHMSLPGVKVKN